MNQSSLPGNTTSASGRFIAERENDDALEYEAFAEDQDPLDIEAATWVVRLRNGLDAVGEAELRDWLDEDPSHQAAFDDMDGTFGRLRDMPQEEVQSLRSGLNAGAPASTIHMPQATQPDKGQVGPVPQPRPVAVPPRPASPGRRAWMLDIGRLFPQAAAAAVAFGAVGGGWLGWQHWRGLPTYENRYATARGQRLQAQLPDGSSVAFDTDTQAEVRLYRDRREVQLAQGQAMFSVQADSARPFHVFSGGLRITVVGTRFSVRHTHSGLDAGVTRVVVEEGRVRVQLHARNGEDSSAVLGRTMEVVELVANQSVATDVDGRLGLVSQVAPGSVAPWREGRINFDNTSLAQALAEFERYGVTGLAIRDPAVAAMRVGGSFQLQHFDKFVQSLPAQLPVRLQRRGAVTEVIATR